MSEIECFGPGETIQMVTVSVDEELLRQAVLVCENAIENARECLDNAKRGRIQLLYAQDIEQAMKLCKTLREKLSWFDLANNTEAAATLSESSKETT